MVFKHPEIDSQMGSPHQGYKYAKYRIDYFPLTSHFSLV